MSEVLRQALSLTAWGMGMTFLSIGALAVGMYLLTLLTRDKQAEPSPGRSEEETGRDGIMTLEGGPLPDVDEARRRAVAAAIAVAQALAEDEQSVRMSPAEARPAGNEAWNAYARALNLSRRAHYDLRRVRR